MNSGVKAQRGTYRPWTEQPSNRVPFAVGHELLWEGDTAVTARTRHEIRDGHYEAREWGSWALAVGTAEGPRSIVGDTVDAFPHVLGQGEQLRV